MANTPQYFLSFQTSNTENMQIDFQYQADSNGTVIHFYIGSDNAQTRRQLEMLQNMPPRLRILEAQRLGQAGADHVAKHGIFPPDNANLISWLIGLPQHQYPSVNPSNGKEWYDSVISKWNNEIIRKLTLVIFFVML